MKEGVVGMGPVAQYQLLVSPTHPTKAEGASRLDRLLEMGVSAPKLLPGHYRKGWGPDGGTLCLFPAPFCS